MPSAGRPFTAELVGALQAAGVRFAPITLHTGVSSLEAHEPPYAERYRVPVSTARLVNEARTEGHRVIAVGTTATRALETDAVAGRAHAWRRLDGAGDHPRARPARSSTGSSAAGTSPRPATSSSWRPSPAAPCSRPATAKRWPSATAGTSSATSTSSSVDPRLWRERRHAALVRTDVVRGGRSAAEGGADGGLDDRDDRPCGPAATSASVRRAIGRLDAQRRRPGCDARRPLTRRGRRRSRRDAPEELATGGAARVRRRRTRGSSSIDLERRGRKSLVGTG